MGDRYFNPLHEMLAEARAALMAGDENSAGKSFVLWQKRMAEMGVEISFRRTLKQIRPESISKPSDSGNPVLGEEVYVAGGTEGKFRILEKLEKGRYYGEYTSGPRKGTRAVENGVYLYRLAPNG